MKYTSWPVMVALSFVFACEVLASEWYVAPIKGGPSIRVDVSHRSACDNVRNFPKRFKIDVIAPERVAYTVKAKPTLYWRVNKKVRGTFVLTVEEMSSGFSFNEPLIEKFFRKTAKPWRLQKISLTKLGVRLKMNVDYKWTVALVCNKKMRSTDIGQSGGIRYVSKPRHVKRNWETLAKNGVWYDAFRRANKSQRKRLLKEIGL
jgi:hypothetical protein